MEKMGNRRWRYRLTGCVVLCGFLMGPAPVASQIPGTFTKFDAPGAGADAGQGTSPRSINDHGEITGEYKDASSVLPGFLRHADGSFTTFEALGASKSGDLGTFAMSINRAGEITGYYQSDPDTVIHGCIVKPSRVGNRSGP